MKGLLILLVCIGVASAAVPAVHHNRGIADDIVAVVKCLEGLFNSVQGQVNNIIDTVRDFQNLLTDTTARLQECTRLEDPFAIADCIVSVGMNLQQDVINGINNIQQAIGGLLSLPNDIVDCIKILG